MVRFTHPTAPPHIPISPAPPVSFATRPDGGRPSRARAAKPIKTRAEGSGTAETLPAAPADAAVRL